MEMTNQEKLDLINSLEIVDVDMDCEGLIYAHVEYSPENLAILGKADIFQREEGKFVIFSKEEVMDMYMEEREKRLNLESRYQKLKHQIEAVG